VRSEYKLAELNLVHTLKTDIDERYMTIPAFDKPIYVTRSYLPPLEEFVEGLKEIWDSQWLTNNGPVL